MDSVEKILKSLENQLHELTKLPRSRESALSCTKLEESIMWLEKDLKRLNELNEPKG